jgi:N-acetylmuramoyl-L-alanine amidase
MRGVLLAMGVILSTITSAMETATTVEVADDLWEPIPIEELEAPAEQSEVFARTHDVKVNEFTYEEARLFLSLAQAEAGNQGVDGMWLVMSVVFNRKESGNYPDTIHDVIYQKLGDYYQFSTVSNGSIDQVEISAEAHLALARIEKGEVAPQIVAFETLTSNKLDKYFTRAFEYKDHRFYTEKIDGDN